MPFCPKCGAEYRREISRCSDCDCALVEKRPDKDEDNIVDGKIVLLCQTHDLVSISILEEALKEQNIPCFVKKRMGTYSGLMSLDNVMKGVEIFVPESAYKEAIEIAETIIPDLEGSDEKN